MKFLCLFLVALGLSACHHPIQKVPEAIASKPNDGNVKTVDVSDLVKEKEIIDQSLIKDTSAMLVYIKKVGQSELIKINDLKFPDDSIAYSYNILVKNGRVKAVLVSPFDETGDSDLDYIHYFDNGGKTFAFQFRANFFGGLPNDGVIRQSTVRFFNRQFVQIKKVDKLVDDKGKKVSDDAAVEIPEEGNKAYANVAACLKAYNLPFPEKM